MIAPPGGPQPVAERRAAEARLGELVARFAPDHERTIGELRKRLRERLPAASEIVYEYRDFLVVSLSPSEHGYEGVFAIRAGAQGVDLHFQRGRELPDPEKLLRGSGTTRSIRVEDASILARPAVASLVEQAIARSPAPFPATGRGQVILSPSSTRKGRGRRSD